MPFLKPNLPCRGGSKPNLRLHFPSHSGQDPTTPDLSSVSPPATPTSPAFPQDHPVFACPVPRDEEPGEAGRRKLRATLEEGPSTSLASSSSLSFSHHINRVKPGGTLKSLEPPQHCQRPQRPSSESQRRASYLLLNALAVYNHPNGRSPPASCLPSFLFLGLSPSPCSQSPLCPAPPQPAHLVFVQHE